MSARALWACAVKDLLRLAQDKLAFALWLGIPLAIGSAITLATGGKDGPAPKAQVWLVNEDDGLIAELLVGSLSNIEVIETGSVGSVEEGQRRLLDGEGTAVLVIPEGFGDALIDEQPSELRLITNPSQRILPGIVEESLDLFAEGSFYLHRLMGEEIRTIFRTPDDGEATLPDVEVAAISVAINEIVREVEQYLFPPVIKVELESSSEQLEQLEESGEEEQEESVPVSLLFLPGILFMAMFFTAQGLSEDLWKEKEEGTLRRGLCSSMSAASLLAGKALAASVVMGAVALVALTIGTAYHGLSWSFLPVAAVWTMLAGTGSYLAFSVLLTFAGTRRGASILANAILFPLMMLGGSFFPLEVMPDWMASLGRLSPNGFAVERLGQILRSPPDAFELAGNFALAVLVVGALGAWAIRRLPRFAGAGR